ncbi:MAG: hypothetical protein GY720_24320 [bacterium]|nr:hypothetical protein [bacterium]
MKRSMFLMTLMAIALMVFGSSGCNSLFGGSSSEGDSNADNYSDSFYEDTNLDLEDPSGGYDTADEQPAFGDAEFAAMFEEDPEVTDAVGDETDVIDMEAEAGARVYYLRLLWGQLRADTDIEEVTDWAGAISVDRGAIVVKRRIKFEHLTDWVVLPREDEKVVDLYSLTRPHFDGLLLKIIDPTPELDEINDLVIDMGPAQITVAVADLNGYEAVVDIDDLGNQMSFQSPQVLDCPNGFLHGIWVKRSADERGIFRGVFTSYEGGRLGHMRGHWGINEAGERVFRGKYIGLDGAFRGLLSGTWSSDTDSPQGFGDFEGEWMDENEETQGQLGGHYRRGFRRGGFFGGRWVSEECGL